jgi:sensor c-di-GMP phosphodiesterase-like protein
MIRVKIIGSACFAAVLILAACIISAVALSWHLAVNNAINELIWLNQRVITRTDHAFDGAIETLRSMNQSRLQPCSEAHIAKMRQATANNRYIEGVAYFQNELLLCSAWGLVNDPIKRARIDYMNKDGVGVSVNLSPKVSQSAPRVGLYLGSYGVVINPEELLDSITDPDNQFAIANEQGLVFATRNDPDGQFLQTLLANPANGIDDERIYSVVDGATWTAVALKPRHDINASFNREALRFVPIGLLLATALISLIVWITRQRLSPLGELKVAVRERHFIVYYQPIIDIAGDFCVGAEALVRWQQPNGTIVTPAEFIDLAEASGLILPITDQVIQCIVRDLGSILQSERSMHVAINLSASDISTGRFIDVLDRQLGGTGIRNRQIWLEATERGFVDVETARSVTARARTKGYKIAIDDFGIGFSNLQHLESLSIDALKIDKSFVHTIGKRTSKSPVLPHIIEIAHSLKLICIAEGVEYEEQLKYLRDKGVEQAQGWLVAKPLPPEEFIEFYRSRKAGTGKETTESRQAIRRRKH